MCCLNLPSCEVKTSWHFTMWEGLSPANLLLHIPLKMDYKIKKTLSPAYSLNLKNIFLFLNRGLSLFFSPTLKIYVEIDNVDPTLFNVVNANVDIRNVVSTLIWRCVTSRLHINLKTTLKRRWNVCWDLYMWDKSVKKYLSYD